MTPDEKREKVVAYLLHLAHLIENSDPESISGMISLEVVSADRSCASLVIHQPSRERKAEFSLAFKVDMDLDDDGEHLEDVEPHPTQWEGDPGCGGNAHVQDPPLSGLTPGGVCRERSPGPPGPPGYDPSGRKKI